jgi:hypothetical protein
MISYWCRVLAAAWSETIESLRLGTWRQFIIKCCIAILGIVAVGGISGPLAALASIGRTIAGIIAGVVVFVAFIAWAIMATAAKMDREKSTKIAELEQSLADRRDRREIGIRLMELWKRGDRLARSQVEEPKWRVDVVFWYDELKREADHLSESEKFKLMTIAPALSMELGYPSLAQYLSIYLPKLRLVVDRHLKAPGET